MKLTRKFALACFFALGSFVLAEQGKLGGSEWVAVTTLIMATFGAANVADKKLGGAG